MLSSSMCTAGMRGDIRSEWDETKQHDVLFLLTIHPPDQADLALMQHDGAVPHPAEKFGLAYVRGCEVLEVKDEGATLYLSGRFAGFRAQSSKNCMQIGRWPGCQIVFCFHDDNTVFLPVSLSELFTG